MQIRTPPVVDKHIQRLIARVSLGALPVFLDVRPEVSAVPGEGFANVAAKVAVP